MQLCQSKSFNRSEFARMWDRIVQHAESELRNAETEFERCLAESNLASRRRMRKLCEIAGEIQIAGLTEKYEQGGRTPAADVAIRIWRQAKARGVRPMMPVRLQRLISEFQPLDQEFTKAWNVLMKTKWPT